MSISGEVIHSVVANGDPTSDGIEEVTLTDEENKTSKDGGQEDEIETIENEEAENPKPKPKKKRDSGYTKSLQEATINLKIADNQRQRRVQHFNTFA